MGICTPSLLALMDMLQNMVSSNYIEGGDGKTYFELKLKGGFKGKDGSFEYIKDNKNIINHRFFKENK